jgi:hypothetical protein
MFLSIHYSKSWLKSNRNLTLMNLVIKLEMMYNDFEPEKYKLMPTSVEYGVKEPWDKAPWFEFHASDVLENTIHPAEDFLGFMIVFYKGVYKSADIYLQGGFYRAMLCTNMSSEKEREFTIFGDLKTVEGGFQSLFREATNKWEILSKIYETV